MCPSPCTAPGTPLKDRTQRRSGRISSSSRISYADPGSSEAEAEMESSGEPDTSADAEDDEDPSEEDYEVPDKLRWKRF